MTDLNQCRGHGGVWIGVDLVYVPAFADQLGQPGTRLAEPGLIFTATELADAREGAHADAVHLAGRWAVKEALIKAWSSSIFGLAPVSGDAVHRHIAVIKDAWNRPQLRLSGGVAEQLAQHTTQVSLSHDGDYAVGYVVLCRT